MVTTATLIALITGTLVPALTALITKDTATAKTKALLTAGLSVVSGVVVGILQTPPHGTAQWEEIVGAALITWIAAASSYAAGWKPSGATTAINHASANFGFGPPADPPSLAE